MPSTKSHSEKQVKDGLYKLASILWDLLPDETKVKLGIKADFVNDFYNENFKNEYLLRNKAVLHTERV